MLTDRARGQGGRHLKFLCLRLCCLAEAVRYIYKYGSAYSNIYWEGNFNGELKEALIQMDLTSKYLHLIVSEGGFFCAKYTM